MKEKCSHTSLSFHRSAGSAPRVWACRVLVEGRVQGVGYRQACAQAARQLGLAGWVRNRRDGRVEAVFEGPAATVGRMVAWCREGPRMANVTDVVVSDEAPTGLTGFRVGATQ